MRGFSSSTLLGNWQEERSRAPPLKGGLADYGFREGTPTYRADFPGHDASHPHIFPRFKGRYGMLTSDTLNEAAYSYGTGEDDLPAKFDTTLGAGAALATAGQLANAGERFTTTARAAFSGATGISAGAAAVASKDASAFLRSAALAPAAGGGCSIAEDRGKRTSGVSGELLRVGADPKTNTAAQRSWLYRADAALQATLKPDTVGKPAAAEEANFMSLQLPSAQAAAAGAVSPSLGIAGTRALPAAGASLVGTRSNLTIAPAYEGAPHGKFAAFAAAPRVVTSITATPKDFARLPGRKIFADDP